MAVVGNVLYIAAHPDDENTQLLSYLVNDRLLHATYLSVTRGDGGQNLDRLRAGTLLGLIRTQELLAARRTDGAEQFFTRARDFGFSKTADETLRIWGHDEVLHDVVWLIRRARPDVVVTRFSPADTDTHGHHTASARLAVEAFKLAGDATYHPDEVAQVGTWQPRRIFWNHFSFSGGQLNGPSKDELAQLAVLDVGGYSALRGISYGEMAADSRSMHKSQGFGATKRRGTQLEYFSPLDGKAAGASPLDGVNLSWSRIPNGDTVQKLVDQARREFSPAHPAASIPALLRRRSRHAKAPRPRMPKQQKLDEVRALIVACAGLYLEASAADPVATPGAALAVTATALNRSASSIVLKSVQLVDGRHTLAPGAPPAPPLAPAKSVAQPLPTEVALKVDVTATLDAQLALSNPYWLAEPPTPGLFTVAAPDIGPPETPGLEADFVVAFGDHVLSIRRPVLYKWTDPTAGERTRAFEIAPPVTVNPAAANVMFPDGGTQTLRVVLTAQTDAPQGERGELVAHAPDGWRVEPAHVPLTLAKKGDEQVVILALHPAAAAGEATLALSVSVDGKSWSRAVRHIDYPHIPIQVLFPPSSVRLCRFDMKRGAREIGYIPGPGDEVAPALEQVGYHVTRLDDDALTDGSKLGRFAAIVIGVRAFNTNKRLPFHHDALMSYVKAGGVIVAQYNTRNWLSQVPSEIGPYPLTISSNRVTDENATVDFALPAHAVLHHPNVITAADFAGWVQERGLYFADPFDARYDTPLSMHDPAEPARKGSLLVARLGKGRFVYTGLSFFRQLPAGVPGAFRLFANLLAPDLKK